MKSGWVVAICYAEASPTTTLSQQNLRYIILLQLPKLTSLIADDFKEVISDQQALERHASSQVLQNLGLKFRYLMQGEG